MDKIFWGCDDFFSIFCATKQLKENYKGRLKISESQFCDF